VEGAVGGWDSEPLPHTMDVGLYWLCLHTRHLSTPQKQEGKKRNHSTNHHPDRTITFAHEICKPGALVQHVPYLDRCVRR
jgi:hypothetical protein